MRWFHSANHTARECRACSVCQPTQLTLRCTCPGRRQTRPFLLLKWPGVGAVPKSAGAEIRLSPARRCRAVSRIVDLRLGLTIVKFLFE